LTYYTYAYLREDGSPYYIGKGKGDRAYRKGSREFDPPKDKQRILFLKKDLTEEDAFRHEIYMISVYGRKDLGTGILHNKTNGGEGRSGSTYRPTEEHKDKIREKALGRKRKPFSKEWKEKLANILRENRHLVTHKPQIGKHNGMSKSWRIYFSDGRVITLCGIVNWCKENGYTKGGIYKVGSGKWNKYRDIIRVDDLG